MARTTVVAALLGCAAAIMLDTLGMIVAGAALGDAAADSGRLGRGILAVAAIGTVVLALVAGVLSTAARFALADLYSRVESRDRRLADTLLVRGQVTVSPSGPAMASFVGLGGLALLAAIPCIVLAAEHAGRLSDELHRGEFVLWMLWSGGCVAVALLAAATVWWLSAVDRRWRTSGSERLPDGTVGHAGPAVRRTSRAGRRRARRTWGTLERTQWIAGLLVIVGAGLVFLGVFLHQPGLYAEPVRFRSDVEAVIGTGTVIGGVVLALGVAAAIFTGSVSSLQTIRALRRSSVDPSSVTADDRRRVRAVTTSLSSSVTTAQALWTAVAVVAGGWWFAARVDTPVDAGTTIAEPIADVGGALLVIAWLLGGAVLVGVRALLLANGSELRNRFGYAVPSEADDREFPDLPLFGQ
ncbi:hypothetical protein KXS11_02580 [Plantibacter flavus]|uniref:hypothetical protein n=1 Tax=Plantibacter flavus TaxID=150123 RepID=UPI003F182C9C